MGDLSSIRRRVEKLERRQKSLDLAPAFCPYEEIEWQVLRHLSHEDLKILLRVRTGLDQGRKLDQMDLTDEELRDFEATVSSYTDVEHKECGRFGITVAQYKERRGLAKPAVEQLKQLYIERRRSEIASQNLSKRTKPKWLKSL